MRNEQALDSTRRVARVNHEWHRVGPSITGPEGICDFLMRMREEPPGRPTRQRHVEIFELSFGPIEDLEFAWLRSELESVEPQIVPDSLRSRVTIGIARAQRD